MGSKTRLRHKPTDRKLYFCDVMKVLVALLRGDDVSHIVFSLYCF